MSFAVNPITNGAELQIDGVTKATLRTDGIAIPAATASGDAVQLGYFTPINNAAAVSDLSLGVGQSAYIDFTAATAIPLHIATSDKELYELFLSCTGTAATGLAVLQPNNTTYTTKITVMQLSAVSNGSVSTNTLTEGVFRLSVIGTPYFSKATICTAANAETLIATARETTATLGYVSTISAVWADATAWTSLGTITCATALTGCVTVKRIA